MRENYYIDNRVYQFKTVISSSVQNEKGVFEIELKGTYFYPEGGGQPADRGTIEGIVVEDVQKRDGKVIHFLKKEPKNREVSCKIDRGHRDHYMIQHTGQHLISAVLKHELNIDTISVHLGEYESRIEIDRSQISEDEIDTLEDRVNDLISTNKRVIYHETDDEGLKDFNIRRESKYSGYIRVVEIEDYDSVPCGGVHLSNLFELTLIKVTGFERIRGHIRLTFLIGKNALNEFKKLSKITTAINTDLSTTNDTILEGIEILKKNISTLKVDKRDLISRYTEELITRITSGQEQVLTFTNTPLDLTKKLAAELTDRLDRAILIINRHEKINWYLLDSTDKKVDFPTFKNKILPTVNGKGGGRSSIWQGSGDIGNIDEFTQQSKQYLKEQL